MGDTGRRLYWVWWRDTGIPSVVATSSDPGQCITTMSLSSHNPYHYKAQHPYPTGLSRETCSTFSSHTTPVPLGGDRLIYSPSGPPSHPDVTPASHTQEKTSIITYVRTEVHGIR